MLFGVKLFTLFAFINASPTQKELQEIIRHAETYEKTGVQEASNILNELNGPIIKSGTVNSTGTGCHCVGYNCGCCLFIKVKEIGLDDTVCVNFTYLPTDYGIRFTLTIDKKTLINQTISAKNPPPICIDVPELKKLASLCLEFKDLQISNKTFSGCIDLTARLAFVKVESIQLGCFKIPPGNQPEGPVKSLSNDRSKLDKVIGHVMKHNEMDGYKVKGQRNKDGQ